MLKLKITVSKIQKLIESLVVLPSDNEVLRRQKVFLWICLCLSIGWVIVTIPFSVYFSPWPTCQGFSCILFPWLLFSFVLSIVLLIFYYRYKTIVWPRRCYLTILMIAIPVLLFSHGGFEHCSSIMALVSFHMLLCLVLYDDLKAPAQWMTCSFLIMLVIGIYEAAYNPFENYIYR